MIVSLVSAFLVAVGCCWADFRLLGGWVILRSSVTSVWWRCGVLERFRGPPLPMTHVPPPPAVAGGGCLCAMGGSISSSRLSRC